MKFRSVIPTVLLAAGLYASSASAATIALFTDSVKTTDPTQLGRPSRNGVPQQWVRDENYPGVLATSVNTTYYYKTYTYAATGQLFTNDYIDISVFDETNSGLFFVSAYFNSYDPNNRAQNWLGDVGSSGNIQFYSGDPGNARTFDVVLPYATSLVLVVNTTGGGTSGTGALYDIAINAFSDTNYGEAPALATNVTPEPSTFIELGTGLLAMAGVARRRFMASV